MNQKNAMGFRTAGAMLALVACCGALVTLHAEESVESVPNEFERLKNLKDLADPTMIRRRWSIENEWKNLGGGDFNDKLTLGYVWGFALSEKQDIGIRLKTPLAFNDAKSSEFGIGDIDLALGTIINLNDKVRTGGSMELRFNSATNSALGDNRWRWCPAWGVSWDVSKHLRTELLLQYDHSFAEEPGVNKQRLLEIHLPITLVLPDDWSVTLEYKPEVDFEKNGTWNNIIRTGVSKHLKSNPLALSLFYEQPLYGEKNECKVVLTLTRFVK